MSNCCKRRKYQQIQDPEAGGSVDVDAGDMSKKRNQWLVLIDVLPYLWPNKSMVDSYILVRICCFISMLFMIASKVFTVLIPLASKNAVDLLTPAADNCNNPTSNSTIIFPWGWILIYGGLKLSESISTNLRDCFFVQVSQNAVRAAALQTFIHLHALSLRFHLARKTGGVLRAIERGTQGIQFLLTFALFNIVPTLLELLFVTVILSWLFKYYYALIMIFTVFIYVVYTLLVTEWRTKFRRQMNDLNNDANNKAVDSLLNFETVKYFSNERHESERYDSSLLSYISVSIRSQTSLALLNIGQAAIIASGVVGVMLLGGWQTYKGILTVGDFVALNQYLLQLYVPLNFLGTSFRMIRTSLVDLENMFELLRQRQEVQDLPGAAPLQMGSGKITFDHVKFSYDGQIDVLKEISFTIPAGKTVAVVGPTGSGKSTLSKLLFRFYDVTGGSISIDNQVISHVQQKTLRECIGIVPQDTVLFNETIKYNIAYGNPNASDEQIFNAARLAAIHEFIMSLPEGYSTMVGERGLKISGGERQRVAIARAILKNPRILILDEATSALDSKTEKEIQSALDEIAINRTTLIIVHRLSTIVNSHRILVLKNGIICEQGTFEELLDLKGEFYEMWQRQNQKE